jgi:hypothetical protein
LRRVARREALQFAVAAIAATALGAHTPYGQWTVYRQRNLFIVASRTDPRAVAIAAALAHGLARELPESHARMTRASDPVRIASLLATGQLEVAVVAHDEAAGMLTGAGAYRAVGAVPLRALAQIGGRLLVTVDAFKIRHAYLLADAVEHLRAAIPLGLLAASTGALTVPFHPGAIALRERLPLPDSVDER